MQMSEERPGFPDIPTLKWDDDNASNSLRALFEAVQDDAQSQIDWYADKAKPKRRFSFALRIFAIMLAILGGLCPIVGEINGIGLDRIGYVLFALAAGCVVFDQLFGVSSGWMRFMSAQLELKAGLDRFRLDWAELDARVEDGKPTLEDVQEHIDLLKAFNAFVHDTVLSETAGWVAEFRSNLRELTKFVKAKRRPPGKAR